MNKVFFVSVNEYKANEVGSYVEDPELEIVIINKRIQEIMDLDLAVIVKDKILQAYKILKQPCVVEHGGLSIDALGGLPGGLSKVVWDTVGDNICQWLSAGDSRGATAKSNVG